MEARLWSGRRRWICPVGDERKAERWTVSEALVVEARLCRIVIGNVLNSVVGLSGEPKAQRCWRRIRPHCLPAWGLDGFE